MPDNLTLDVYLPPHELQQHRQVFERPLAQIAQIFAESIALPHLNHTQDYRSLSGLPRLVSEATHARAMSASTATQLTEQLIPSPINDSGAHFHFQARSPSVWNKLFGTVESGSTEAYKGSDDGEDVFGKSYRVDIITRGRDKLVRSLNTLYACGSFGSI